MKPLILLLFLLCSIASIGQGKLTYKASMYPDSANIFMCKERGHLSSGIVMTTLVYCPKYFIETDSTTIEVTPACNYHTYNCQRCGVSVTEQEKENRRVIWRKSNN